MYTLEQQTKDMIAWLLDCFNDEFDQEEIRSLDFPAARKAVSRYYDGGFKAFIEDSQNNQIAEVY